jgi:uncharacterized membrane protein YvlD (DUF360 family)
MSSNHNDGKEPRKPTEEEIQELLRQIKKPKKPHRGTLGIVFLLHPNYLIHLLLSFAINTLVAAVLFGFAASMNQDFATLELFGFLTAIGLITLIENFVKILLYRFLTQVMLMSMGLLPFIVTVIVLYAVNQIVVEGFEFTMIEHLIVFAFLFSAFRLIFSAYIRKMLFNKPVSIIRKG